MDDPTPPHIFYFELPSQEQTTAAAIVENLRALNAYRRWFADDLRLFEFADCNRKSQYLASFSQGVPWMFIAARDGAMMLYHFGMTLRAFGGLLRRAPTLVALVDTKAVEEARQAFETHFKDFYHVRQGVAHLADHSVTPDRRGRHSIKKDNRYIRFSTPRLDDGSTAEPQGAGYFTRNNLSGHTFWGTVEGETVEYDISQESLEKLQDVERIIYAAFQRAQEETQRSHLARQRERGIESPDWNSSLRFHCAQGINSLSKHSVAFAHAPPSASAAPTPGPSLPGRGGRGG